MFVNFYRRRRMVYVCVRRYENYILELPNEDESMALKEGIIIKHDRRTIGFDNLIINGLL